MMPLSTRGQGAPLMMAKTRGGDRKLNVPNGLTEERDSRSLLSQRLRGGALL